MKSRSLAVGLAAAAGMMVLILDSRTAVEGIREGIDLCLKTLIPSLFPFFVLSILMTGNLSGRKLQVLRPIGRLCGVPEGCDSLIVTGFLGGYPVGAQSIALAWEQGVLSQEDAKRLLGFCSNAGPAFLFGVVGPAFDTAWVPWLLWAIHMASALIVGTLSRAPSGSSKAGLQSEPVSLTQALQRAITVMAQVSGWVILFRMVLTYLDRWFLWMLPGQAQVLASGILELSNGCVQLGQLETEGTRFLAASLLLALGGICVTLQTCSVTRGLSLRSYFPGKLLQAAFSILMAIGAQLCLPAGQRCAIHPAVFAGTVLFALILTCFLRKAQKNSSIPLSVGV